MNNVDFFFQHFALLFIVELLSRVLFSFEIRLNDKKV